MKPKLSELRKLVGDAINRKRATIETCKDAANPSVKEMVTRSEGELTALMAVYDFIMREDSTNLKILAYGIIDIQK